MGKKAKPKVWCECPTPQPLVDGEGVPFCAEPLCRTCQHAIKRALPTAHVQHRAPVAAWVGPGPCPRPPELDTAPARRGAHQAYAARQLGLVEVAAILEEPEHLSEPQLVAFTDGLARLRAAEAADPSPASARHTAATPPPAPILGARDRAALRKLARALQP